MDRPTAKLLGLRGTRLPPHAVTLPAPLRPRCRITRQDLAAGLEATLAAEPLFAPHVVPLACEKLSSSLRWVK